MSDRVPVSIRVNGAAVASSTTIVAASAYVLAFSTTITDPRAPFSLHSTYVGQRREETGVTHLMLVPADVARLTQVRHPADTLPVAENDRHLCLYDHLQVLLAGLRDAGLDVLIDVGDSAVQLV